MTDDRSWTLERDLLGAGQRGADEAALEAVRVAALGKKGSSPSC